MRSGYAFTAKINPQVQLAMTMYDPSGVPNIPISPDFVLRWFKVGKLDPKYVVRENLHLLENRGVYLIFVGRKKIQYVGITYTQSFEKRVGQHLQGMSRIGGVLPETAHLYIAVVEPKEYKRVSRKMLEEIESLLIWIIKPGGNSVKKTPYTGRDIAIQNVDADFGLPEYLHAIRVGSSLNVGYGSPGSMKSKVISLIR